LIPIIGSLALVAWRLTAKGLKQSDLDSGKHLQEGGKE